MEQWPDLSRNDRDEGRKRARRDAGERTLDRRRFLAMLGAGGLALAEGIERIPDFKVWSAERARRMHFAKWDALPPKERDTAITRERTIARDFIRSAEGMRILESGSDDELFFLINGLPALLREQLEGTSYEVPKDQWVASALGIDPRDGTMYLVPHSFEPTALRGLAYGNCVRVSSDMVMTNCHIPLPGKGTLDPHRVPFVHPEPLERLREEYLRSRIDVAYVNFGTGMNLDAADALPIVPLPSHASDSAIVGEFVTVEGIDPDASAAQDGTKVYASSIIPVTARVAEFLDRYTSLPGAHYETGGFMYIAPPGESMQRPLASASGSRLWDLLRDPSRQRREDILMYGMSGAPVRMGRTLVGVNYHVGQIEYAGHAFDLGFFEGPEAMKDALEAQMAISSTDTLIDVKDDSPYVTGRYEAYGLRLPPDRTSGKE